jgi:two-component system response regulator HydG
MERAVILLQGEYVSERELPIALQNLARTPGSGIPAPVEPTADATLADRERQIICRILQETGGNKSEAARRLGITRRTLKLKLKKYSGDGAPGERHGSR